MSEPKYTREPPPENGWYFAKRAEGHEPQPFYFALQPHTTDKWIVFEGDHCDDWTTYLADGATCNHAKLEPK